MIELRSVSLRIGSHAMHSVDLLVPAGESHVLLGPSGAGKTLLLESILGLRPLLAGEVFIGGVAVTHRPPEHRGVGYMPQDGALFPHLSVKDNILFGRRVHRTLRNVESDLEELCTMLQISQQLVARRSISSLSGGEQQRVALARALITKPKVLLLDESFSALDSDVRRQLLVALRALQQATGQTLIYVTHHQDDAEVMADRVTIVVRGKIAQTTSALDMWRRPRTLQIAQFLQVPNIVRCAHPNVAAANNESEPYCTIDLQGWQVRMLKSTIGDNDLGSLSHVSIAADLLQIVASAPDSEQTKRRLGSADNVTAATDVAGSDGCTRIAGVVKRVGYSQRRARAWVQVTQEAPPCLLECDLALWQANAGVELPQPEQLVSVVIPAHAITPIFDGAPTQ